MRQGLWPPPEAYSRCCGLNAAIHRLVLLPGELWDVEQALTPVNAN